MAFGSAAFAMALAAAFAGGAINAVAGGGSFLTYPALLALGLPPVCANATSTLALWPGSAASAWALRGQLRPAVGVAGPLLLVCASGSSLGAWLLLRGGDASFAKAVPWLFALATVLFAAAPWLVGRLRRGGDRLALVPLLAVQFAVATYGGYFGGGQGILMLAAFALCGIGDPLAANALKSLLGWATNGTALLIFAGFGPVQWQAGLPMLLCGIAGGYAGARLSLRVPAAVLRAAVVVLGAAATALLFLRQF